MKHKFSFVISLWWILLLGLLAGMIIWLAPKEERASEMENRNLAGAPTLNMENIFDSSYMSGVEDFLADGFFMRIQLIETSANIKNIFNIKTEEEMMDNNMEEGVTEFMEEAMQINAEDESALNNVEIDEINNANDIESDAENTEQGDAQVTLSGEEYTFWWDMSDGTQRMIYSYPKENLDISINALNAYREVLPENGEVHFFQIPYGYLANMMIYDNRDKYAGWGCDAENYMQENAIDGVYIHNGPEILEPYLMEGELLYFRTDYHWTPLGAYYGHAGIMEDMNLPYLEFDDYDYKVYENFIGAGYGKNPSAAIRAKADKLQLIYPIFPTESYISSDLEEKQEAPIMYYSMNSYRGVLGGTLGPYRQFITGANTGRKCLIFSDSFGNAFAPYMFPYYDEVHMTDLRPAYFTKSKTDVDVKEYIEHNGVDDIYFMMSTSSSMNSVYMLKYLMRYLEY